MHQITAFGGLKGPAPFQQAIPQSPGFQLIPGNLQQEETLQTFLALLNVSTIDEARQLPLSALVVANIIQVANSSYGDFTYGPVVDGLFAPALPGKLLLQGSYDKNLTVMVGHNADEGLLFTNPLATNNTETAIVAACFMWGCLRHQRRFKPLFHACDQCKTTLDQNSGVLVSRLDLSSVT